MKKKMVILVLLTLMLLTAVVPVNGTGQLAVSTQPTIFPDLQDAWSKDAITWAVNKSIVGGYPDGTFKPRADVLEAEWTAMMFKYLEPCKKLDPPGSGHHWSESIYNHIEHYKLPMRGHQTVTARNIPLKRVEIAKITSALYGFNLSEAQAVEFMYDNDFSSGMGGGRYYHTYGVDQNLQRQQAVMFLMKVDNQVKANGGVTYRGQFYPMAQGPIGIPTGGQKFPNTTVDSIDWSRFNEQQAPIAGFIAPKFKPAISRVGSITTILTLTNGSEYASSGENYLIQVECVSHPGMNKYDHYNPERGWLIIDQAAMRFPAAGANILFELGDMGMKGTPARNEVPAVGETVTFKVTVTRGNDVQVFNTSVVMGEGEPLASY